MPFIKSFSKKLTLSATLALSALSLGTQAQAFEPFLGEVRTFGFNFCPRGWVAADGQLLPINQYNALFALYGTIYGGDGRTTFALPDLRGRFAMHQGSGPGLSSYPIGQRGGVEDVSLTEAQMPSHSHWVLVGQTETGGNHGGLVVRQVTETGMAAGGTDDVGGSRSHNNMPPYLVMNTCIATQGIFHSRS